MATSEGKLVIQIRYCGGWGYGRYYQALGRILVQEFGEAIEVVGLRDNGTTGNFDVTIVNTGELIHSKKSHGQGRCETVAEQQAVIDKIREVLEA